MSPQLNHNPDMMISEVSVDTADAGEPVLNTIAHRQAIQSENRHNVALTDSLDRESRILIDRIRMREICLVTRQLSALLRAGLPLVGALSALTEQYAGRPIAFVITDVRDRVKAGISFSEALGRYPKLFSNLYRSMVMAGEASGALETILTKLADAMEKRLRLAATVRSALTYPAFMAVAAIGVVVFLTAFVVPSITKIFIEMKQKLPWPTVALIHISALIRGYGWLILVGIMAGIMGIRVYIGAGSGRDAWDRFRLRLPLFGPLLNRIEQARFARTMSLLLSSGIGVLDSLAIVKGIIQNGHLAGRLDQVCVDISRGQSPADALKRMNWLSPIMIHAIAVGELTGSLEEQLNEMAAMVEEDIERSVRAMTSLLEPAVLMAMGIMVGFIVLAILLPIFDIQQMF